VPTRFHFGSQNPSKSRLGDVLRRLGGVLSPFGSLLGGLGGVLEALGRILEALEWYPTHQKKTSALFQKMPDAVCSTRKHDKTMEREQTRNIFERVYERYKTGTRR